MRIELEDLNRGTYTKKGVEWSKTTARTRGKLRSVLQLSMKQTAAAVGFAISERYGPRTHSLRFYVRLRIIERDTVELESPYKMSGYLARARSRFGGLGALKNVKQFMQTW